MKAITIDKVAGVPREIEVAGSTFKMSQITVNILTEVETWARSLPYKRLKEKLAELPDAPKEVKARWYEQADKEAQSKEYVQRELESMNGVLFMLRKCFKVHHPDMSEDTFTLILNAIGLDVLQGFLEDDNSISGVDDVESAIEKKG